MPRSTRPMKRSRMAKRNDARLAKRRAVEFGPQAELSRHLPCCACHPGLYRASLDALQHQSTERQCDPHHLKTRPGGTDRDCVPLCASHHAAVDAVGSGPETVQAEAGIRFDVIAKRLAHAISPNPYLACVECEAPGPHSHTGAKAGTVICLYCRAGLRQ